MDITELAIQLGMALSSSKEVVAMREAEDNLENDTEAVEVLQAIDQNQQQIADLLTLEEDHSEEVNNLVKLKSELEEKALKNPSIIAVKDTQTDFANLMERVNTILRYYITGESGAESGCIGGCEGCKGCGQ